MSRWLPGANVARPRAFVLVAVVVVTILVVQMLTTIVGALLATRQAEQVATDTFGYVGELTAERVSRFAEAGRDVSQGTADELELLGADIGREALVMSLYQRLIREPVVRAIYVGWPDGEFMVLRREGDGFVSQRGQGGDDAAITSRVYDESFAVLSESVEMAAYDPRERPWYLAGLSAVGTRWTQPYVDFFDGETLVSAAHPAREGDEVTAVVGADVDLADLATVLDGIPYGEGAEAFVLTQRQEVIAAPSSYRERIHSVVAETRDVAYAADIGLNVDDTLVLPDSERFDRELNQVVLDRGFPAEEGLPWRLHIRASDGELSAGLGGLGNIVFTITAVSFVIVLVAGAAMWRVRHPLGRMRERATTDSLTGLLNRHEFFRRGQLVAGRAVERGDVVMVTVLDLDEFKNLNDKLGHAAGDQALGAVAAGMTGSARAGDLAARLGGDEFAMMHVLREGDRPLRVAQRIRDGVEHEIHTRVAGSEDVGVTAGYTTGGAGVEDLDLLIDHADQALVAGKRVQKGRVYASAESVTAVDRRS